MLIQHLRHGGALVCFLFLSGCGDSEQPAPEPPPSPVEEATQDVPDENGPVGEPAEEPAGEPETVVDPEVTRSRAEVLGFARYVPVCVEALFTVQHIGKAVEGARGMKIWQSFADASAERPFQVPDEMDDDFSDLQGLAHEDDIFAPGPGISPMEMLGNEVTVVVGEGGAVRLGAWLEFSRRSTYHQMRGVAAALSGAGREAERTATPFSLMGAFFGALSSFDIYGELVEDREAMRAMDAFQMPPIYIAVRAEGERLAEVHEILAEPVRGLANFNDMIAPVEINRAGSSFHGYRLIGEDLASSMEESREFMAEIFGEQVYDRLVEFLKSRDLVALSGMIDDYAVLFFGASADEFRLAESAGEAITGGDALAFVDPLLEHTVYAMMHGEEGLIRKLAESAGGMTEIALGLRDGFAANDRDGRNRDLVALLQVVADRERALRDLTRHAATGIILVDDGGPRLEAHGGTSGMLDFETPSRFAALGDDPEAAVFFNLCVDSRYSERSTAYAEALLETGYAMLVRLMEAPVAGEDDFGFDPFVFIREYAAMFENDFRGDLVNIWRAIVHDVRSGLGRESAIVVDLDGSVPALPGVPESLAGSANSPRLTYLAPVANRERLGSAWKSIHESASRMAGRVGELSESDFPIPGAIRSESGGFSSWFLPFPYFDDEFLPSVTLDDDWFAIGTSRNQAVDLIQRLGDLEPRPGGGMRMHVNFPKIAESQRQQIATLVENRESIIESGQFDAEEFDSAIHGIESIASGLEELDRLEVRYWQQDGVARSRIHLRLR